MLGKVSQWRLARPGIAPRLTAPGNEGSATYVPAMPRKSLPLGTSRRSAYFGISLSFLMFFANIRAMRDRVVKRDLRIGPKHTRSADRVI